MYGFNNLSVVLVLLLSLKLSSCSKHVEAEAETPQENKRSARAALPSVSRDHYSEVLRDGTYKYAYTGEHRYVAERRLPDGTVEGESLYVRPDGVPVKVHYFADKEGYRPKTEVLYRERVGVVATRTAPGVVVPPVREVVVPGPREVVVPRPVHVPHSAPVVVGPPAGGHGSVNVNAGPAFRSGGGGDINVNTRGGDVAAAAPSVTAIVGPGGQALIRPEAVARTSGASKLFRSSAFDSGDVAIANPQTTAIVGAGGSVIVEPRASASVGGGPDVIREVHTRSFVPAPPERIIERVPVPVPVRTPEYAYSAPVRAPAYPAPVVVPASRPAIVAAGPPVVAVRSGVAIIPPSSRYSYAYGYSAPDPKHPQRDNSAYVHVQVNQ